MTAARPDGSSAALSAQEALELADGLARVSSRALGDALAGVILHGSLTLGDYLPGRSDIDLLAVVNAPITLHIDRHHPDERDLVVEFSICRAHGHSILGAPPSELIGLVPDEWVLEVGDAQLADWQAIGDDPPYAQLTVLTACRIWRFAEERRHSSKDPAGQWALRRDPTLQVSRDALHQRRSDPTHPIDAARVHDLLALVRDRPAPSGAGTARTRGVDARPTGP